jgi:peptide/nickel transport system permease protein
VHQGFFRFVARRAAVAAVLVLLVSSAALVLSRLAPGDASDIGTDPAIIAEQRRISGRDLPVLEQYGRWIGGVARLDFGESLRYRLPVRSLIRDRAPNTVLLGASALLVATALGIPLGILTGSRRGGLLIALARGLSVLLLSVPPLVTSLALLLLALRTGWFPVGGLPPGDAGIGELLRHLAMPVLALALPVAASLERLQSRAIADALSEPCVLAALGRGVPKRRVIWRHALRLSLGPVLGIYGIMIGSLLSGSFVVEYVMSWPGLGALMLDALRSRDAYLVAGCAASGSIVLAAGTLLSDVALAAVDPRVQEPG